MWSPSPTKSSLLTIVDGHPGLAGAHLAVHIRRLTESEVQIGVGPAPVTDRVKSENRNKRPGDIITEIIPERATTIAQRGNSDDQFSRI